MAQVSLITGASAGIGLELARVLAENGRELLLVARRLGRLRTLAGQLAEAHGIEVRSRVADLANAEDRAALVSWVRDEGLEVAELINNAGFGLLGRHDHLEQVRLLDLLRVNVEALTDLTHRFLGGMVERGEGRILNVASTAAFQPGPLMAAYFASKAYVVSFSEGLAAELKGTGVTVTALCPGPTKSEFWDVAGFEPSKSLDRIRMPADRVARAGFKGMMKGKRIVIPGFSNRMLSRAARVSPRFLVNRVILKSLKKVRPK